ncbi:hypothetical protein HK104_008968 [Borealophlyctis nickersoniae]|nr:hypothetical protein HK104_008968 [Borealophlyctis nickersoniae]
MSAKQQAPRKTFSTGVTKRGPGTRSRPPRTPKAVSASPGRVTKPDWHKGKNDARKGGRVKGGGRRRVKVETETKEESGGDKTLEDLIRLEEGAKDEGREEGNETEQTDTGPNSPKKGKKGKKFPSQTEVLDLIGAINDKEDVQIERKLEKQAKKKALVASSRKKAQEKKSIKQQELDNVKNQLREKGKRKKKVVADEVEREVEGQKNTPKKRVRFA